LVWRGFQKGFFVYFDGDFSNFMEIPLGFYGKVSQKDAYLMFYFCFPNPFVLSIKVFNE